MGKSECQVLIFPDGHRPLAAHGTYRIALVSEGIMGPYMLNGDSQCLRGRADSLPVGATEIRTSRNKSRTETFVTLDALAEWEAAALMVRPLSVLPVADWGGSLPNLNR